MHLEEDEQKKLFLQLATLVMMSEGDALTTSTLIHEKLIDVHVDNDEDDLDDEDDLEDEDAKKETDKSLIFWQSLNELELSALASYAIECRYINKSSQVLNSDPSVKEDIFKQLIGEISFSEGGFMSIFGRRKSMDLIEVLSKEIDIVIDKNKDDPNLKKQALDNFMANDGDLVNLNGDAMKGELLKLPKIKAEVLENTAKTTIESSKAELDDKVKKIILFELIGAGFSDGYFDDSEKQLFQKICQYLDIDEEYVDEFLELATSFFTLTNDITDLINE